MNPMREIRIDKVTVNIGVGEPGDKLERAKKLLESFTENTVTLTKSKKRSTFGTPKGRPIGTKVTLRGDNAKEFLKMAFEANNNTIKASSADNSGNFSFGIREHIDMPGIKYDPTIGIFGMDICITLERPGFRVKRKQISSSIGKSHRITQEECINFLKENFGVEVQ